MTARDVAFTFNYIVDNKLLNLSTYTNGITGAEVIDDTHVKVTTSAPKANMLRMVVPILPEHIWSKVSGKEATTSYQNKPPIVGDGPFQLVEWKKGKFVRFEANPTYWARQAQGGRGHLRALYQPRHDGPGPQAGRHRRRRRHPAGTVQAAGRPRTASPPASPPRGTSSSWR